MRLVPLSLGLLCVGLGVCLGQENAAEKRQRNPERAFQIGDADLDGRLSREEYRALTAYAPRLKASPQMAERIFTRLDTNRDGFLTRAEYAKIVELRPLMPGPNAPSPAKKARKAAPTAKADAPNTPEQVAFFESKIRPALVAKCYKCHAATAEKIKGGLVLDTRAGIRKGGDTGPAVVPGDLKESLLIQAIRHTDDALKMPPKEKLSDAVIADFERWVKMGAPDPRDGKAATVNKDIDVEKGRQFWAFQPPHKATPPAPKDKTWARTDIDRFLLTRVEAKGLKPVDDADKHTLLRRIYFDLIGLPPTPEEIEAFVGDSSPTAFENVVDKLLESPRFGERWGRHWLDVARFGETSGKQVNFNYPHAWRYRDYVIAAFNADKPYDRFVKEQIAGDLMPAASDKQRAEQIVATGFLAIGPKSHVERDPLQFELDLVDEQIDATSQAFLGLTVACARCHDHKLDPIAQQDYYAFAGIFRSTETCFGTIPLIQNNNSSVLIPLPKDSGQRPGMEPLSPGARKELQAQINDLRKTRTTLLKEGKLQGSPQGNFTGVRLATLLARLDLFEENGTPKKLAMGVRERSKPEDSPLYQRGEVDKPEGTVPRGVVRVVSRSAPHISQGSGRLELADWLASRENPLVARVLVNRVWLHLFGQGLVPTPDNFGAAGQPPSHPELFDHLAVSFMDQKWSVKSLIRQLVLSHAYQLGSRYDAKGFEADPDNVLLWRMTPRRLEGEALRDAMLAVSGQLVLSPPPGSPVSRFGEGPSQVLQRAGAFDARLNCRSVFLPVIRNSYLESLSLFDFPDPGMIVSERATTTVPAQGLYLLNNPFVIRQSERIAEQLLAKPDGDSTRILLAYVRIVNRPPSDRERKAVEGFLASYPSAASGESSRSTKDAWTAFCQALFASADFLYRN